jgi:hypothetical protein
MRVAPIRDLASAPSTVLFDDLVNDSVVQPAPWISAFDVMPISKSALLVLVTPKGDWLVRVDAKGNATPLDVKVD